MAAAAAASGSAPPAGARRRRRRRGRAHRWSKTPKRASSAPPSSSAEPSPDPAAASASAPPPAAPDLPLPAGAEVEVRVDDDGFHGSWFEATVVDFAPARGRGRRAPARYTVTYAHLLADEDGGVLAEHFAPSHVRPRPPPPPPPDSFPPRLRPHDIVEAFHKDGWWSGIVVAAPAAASSSPDALVTVAFPITREVIPFPPRLVRPRRDYVGGGEWAPSLAAIAVRPKRAVRVYQAGDKVEVGRDRDVYGYSWFPATVARVVDDLSYVVEYFDLEDEADEKPTEYLHWRFIRPAVDHLPREGEFHFGPGAAVEAYCDGAWSPGVVRRVVGDGEYEVSLVGKKAEQLVTKVEALLKPQYKWNGKQWRIVTAKRRSNLRRQSMYGKNPSSPVVVESSDDEQQSRDRKFSANKKSRKEPQQLEAIPLKDSEHASISQIGTPLSALCKSPDGNHFPNSCPPLTEKNCQQVLSHNTLNSCPQKESMPNSTGETVDNQEGLSDVMLLDGQLNTPESGATPSEAHDMLSIAELRKKMNSSRRNSAVKQIQKKQLAVKALKVKKDITKSKEGKAHPVEVFLGTDDASDKIRLDGSINFSSRDIVCALTVPVEGQTTSTPVRQVSRRSNGGSSTKVLTNKKLAKRKGSKEMTSPHSLLDATSMIQQRGRKKVAGRTNESPSSLLDRTLDYEMNITELLNQEPVPRVPPGFESMHNGKGNDIHGLLLEEEPNTTISSISQANGNADGCTDHASTQVGKSDHLKETAILSLDHPVQQAGGKVDERSALVRLENGGSSHCTMNSSPSGLRSCSAAGSSMPSHLALSQKSGHKDVFRKTSVFWHVMEAMDAFKVVPQRPHFLPLRELLPDLREGAAYGLMFSFKNLVDSVREATLENSMEWFEDKIAALCHLEENGFSVKFLEDALNKFIEIKAKRANYLIEMDKLKEEITMKSASSSLTEALLDEKDRGIAELEQRLGRLRQESQKISKQKEKQDAEVSSLNSEASRKEEEYGACMQEFHRIMSGLHRKQLN